MLLDSGGPPIGEELLVGDGFKQRWRHDQPADPECRPDADLTRHARELTGLGMTAATVTREP